jgi:hypothetical protein
MTLSACGSSSVAPSAADPGHVDRVELHAWQETLGPAYPLTLTQPDSIAAMLSFADFAAASWRDTAAFPGTPILSALYDGPDLRAEFGFVESSHGQGGWLVNQVGSHIRVRAATASDIARFLAFFDLAVEIR